MMVKMMMMMSKKHEVSMAQVVLAVVMIFLMVNFVSCRSSPSSNKNMINIGYVGGPSPSSDEPEIRPNCSPEYCDLFKQNCDPGCICYPVFIAKGVCGGSCC